MSVSGFDLCLDKTLDIRSLRSDTGVWTADTSIHREVMLVSGAAGRGLAKSLDEAEASATGIIELPADPGCAQLDFNSGRDSSDTFPDLKG